MGENFNTIISELVNNEHILKFKLKCYKDGLVFIKAKTTNGTRHEVKAYDIVGRELLNKVRKTVAEERHNTFRSLRDKGYTQQEIALVMDVSQSAVNYALKNKFEAQG